MHHRVADSGRLMVRLTCLGLVLLSAAAHAAPGGLRPYRFPPNLLQYFKARYGAVDEARVDSMMVTPDGPSGNFIVIGRMRPTVDPGGDTPEARVRSVAKAFIEQEATLLDIPDLAELKETSLGPGEFGQTAIRYTRHIGKFELLGSSIRIDVAPDGAITFLQASMVPVPYDLYPASRRSTISKDEVIKVISHDLWRDPKGPLGIDKPRLVAISEHPYVIWTATTTEGWMYAINAFNGTIVSKNCSGVNVTSNVGKTPCDP